MKLFKKRCPVEETAHQMLWYMHVSPAHKPERIQACDGGIEMEQITPWVEPLLSTVWKTAKNVLWLRDESKKLCPSTYVAYVQERLKLTPLSDYNKLACIFLLNKLGLQDATTLTPVHCVHGDLTMENVYQRYDTLNVGFIDPGHVRWLPCQELDEAKLLQSAEGWKSFCMGGDELPFTPTRLHHLLLLSHYIRLLAHPEKHTGYWLEWAHGRVRHMINSPLGVLYEEARNYHR